MHGVIDYLLVILLFIGPNVAGFRGRQEMFCYVLAVVHLVLTLVTRFPLGVFKIVRLPIHGSIEFAVGLLLLALPWMAGFFRGVHSRNFFFGIGMLILLIWALTDYRGRRDRGIEHRGMEPRL